MKRYRCLASVPGVIVMCMPLRGLGATWEPQKPIEFIIPAGPGGGADVMAHFKGFRMERKDLCATPQTFVAEIKPERSEDKAQCLLHTLSFRISWGMGSDLASDNF